MSTTVRLYRTTLRSGTRYASGTPHDFRVHCHPSPLNCLFLISAGTIIIHDVKESMLLTLTVMRRTWGKRLSQPMQKSAQHFICKKKEFHSLRRTTYSFQMAHEKQREKGNFPFWAYSPRPAKRHAEPVLDNFNLYISFNWTFWPRNSVGGSLVYCNVYLNRSRSEASWSKIGCEKYWEASVGY